MMNNVSLTNLLNSLEKKGVLPNIANKEIQKFLDTSTNAIGKLFLVITALIGATFISAGVFSIISHNWDDFPKHVRGALSFVPVIAGIFVYYLALFKHRHSTSWVEASSLFLMLMVGASIALVSQTYQMDGDFDRFIIVWLSLTSPLFYIARASGIAFFYLLLAAKFLIPHFGFSLFGPSDFSLNDKYLYFWFFLLAVLPHFYITLNKSADRQGFRSIFLGWLIGVIFLIGMPFAVKSGYLWWTTAIVVGYYLLGKKYYNGNISSLGRPFQTISLFVLFYTLTYLTLDEIYPLVFGSNDIREMGTWTNEQLFFYFSGFLLMVGLTILAVRQRLKGKELNRYIVVMPFLIVLLFGIHYLNILDYVDLMWLGFLLTNFYVLGFGINGLIKGNRYKNVLYMFYGLFILSNLMWVRYFDMDIAFWLKGLFFIGVGFIFLLIHKSSQDSFEK
jgi:hypothetical protein